MEFQVRKAVNRDVPQIIALDEEMSVCSLSPIREATALEVKEYRRQDMMYLYEILPKEEFGIFLAESQTGEFLGHIIVGCRQVESSTGELQAWIYDLSVKKEYWGKGVAQKLNQAAEDFAAGFNHKYIGLGVTSSNLRAVKFYENCGYREERKRMLKKFEGLK